MLPQPVGVGRPFQQRRQIPVRRRQHNALRLSVPRRPVIPAVPMQPPNALQQHIHRTKIRNQQIRVNVQRLLQSLRTYHDDAAGRARILAQQLLYPPVQQTPVAGRKPPVMQRPYPLDRKTQSRIARARQLLNPLLRGHRIADSVPNHQHFRPGPGRLQSPPRHPLKIPHLRRRADLHCLALPVFPDVFDAGSRADRRIRPINGVIYAWQIARRIGAGHPAADRPQPPFPRRRTQRRRHQQRIPPRARVRRQQPLQNHPHIHIRCVHLVHHQQIARQAR